MGNYIYLGEQGEQRPKYGEYMGTKTIFGKETIFDFFENRGTSQFISGEQGVEQVPPTPRRASIMSKPHAHLQTKNETSAKFNKRLNRRVSEHIHEIQQSHNAGGNAGGILGFGVLSA